MLKKMSSVFFGILCLFSLGCPVKGGVPTHRKPVYPDKDLKEIKVYGSYFAEDKKALEELKQELLTNERCDKNDITRRCVQPSLPSERCYKSDRIRRCIQPSLYIGETLEEALRNRFSGLGEEGFSYSQYREYCYNETEEENKNPVFNKNLRARLYDREGNLLSEDFLRWDGRSIPKSQSVISYLPYRDEGYKIHVVRLKGKREVILYDIRTPTQSRLREITHYVQTEQPPSVRRGVQIWSIGN